LRPRRLERLRNLEQAVRLTVPVVKKLDFARRRIDFSASHCL